MADWQAIVFVGRLVGPTFYTERFVEYCWKNSIDTYVVDVNDEKTFSCSAFDEFAAKPGTIMFTFNNIGIKLQTAGGRNFWKENRIPVFDFLIDHPRAFADMLKEPECDLYLLALDRNHVDFINKYYKKVKGAYFCPHAGAEMPESDIPFEQRETDVIYMGDCQFKMKSLPKLDFFDDAGQDFYISVSDMLLTDPLMSTESAIRQYLKQKRIELSDESEFVMEAQVGFCVDRNLRRLTKLEGMKALDDLGIRVDVYGNPESWMDDEYEFSDNIVFHERVGREELLRKLCHAKISLCFIPWFRGGISEKNLDSMLNGAVCVTDKSEYLLEHYKDGRDIVYFDISHPEQMACDVKWLLENPSEAGRIAQSGKRIASKYDNWEHRYSYISEIITEHCYKEQ